MSALRMHCQLQSSQSRRTAREDSMCTSDDQVVLTMESAQISHAHVTNPVSVKMYESMILRCA